MMRRGLLREFSVFFTYTVFRSWRKTFHPDHSAAVSGYQYWCAHSVPGHCHRLAVRHPRLKNILCQILFREIVVLLVAATRLPLARRIQYVPFLTRIHVLDLSVDVIQRLLILLLNSLPILAFPGAASLIASQPASSPAWVWRRRPCGFGPAGGRLRLRLCHHGDLSLLRSDLAGVPPGA